MFQANRKGVYIRFQQTLAGQQSPGSYVGHASMDDVTWLAVSPTCI